MRACLARGFDEDEPNKEREVDRAVRSFRAASLALGFAFILALSFAIFSFAFFYKKCVVSMGGIFGGNVTVLVQKEVGEGRECATAERVSCSPSSYVGIELGVRLDGVNKGVNAGELGNCMSSRSKKLVVEMNVAAEVAKVEKVAERRRDQRLSSVDFLFHDVAKHSFDFLDKVQSG